MVTFNSVLGRWQDSERGVSMHVSRTHSASTPTYGILQRDSDGEVLFSGYLYFTDPYHRRMDSRGGLGRVDEQEHNDWPFVQLLVSQNIMHVQLSQPLSNHMQSFLLAKTSCLADVLPIAQQPR